MNSSAHPDQRNLRIHSELKPFSWQRMIEAVEAVRERALRATAALKTAGIPYAMAGGNAGADCFIDGPNGSPRDGVHLRYASEKVRPEYPVPSADVTEIESADDYDIVNLLALLKMKLNSFRRKDQMHLLGMLSVGLIDDPEG